MNKLQALLLDIKDNFTDDEALIDSYIRIEGKTPLDVLIEKENRKEILKILNKLPEILDKIDLQILDLYCVQGLSMDATAEKLHISQPAVTKRLNKISEKIKKTGYEIPSFDSILCKDILTERPVEYNSRPHSRGNPSDIFKEVNFGGRWGVKKGKKIWVSQSTCKLPELFEDCFKDNKTACPYGKCYINFKGQRRCEK